MWCIEQWRCKSPTRVWADRRRDVFTYWWNNACSRIPRLLRSYLDGFSREARGWISTSGTGQVSFAYLGLASGETNILQLFEHQRSSRSRSSVPVREAVSFSWHDLYQGRWPEADLVLVGAEARLIQRLPTSRSVVSPYRVHMVIRPGDNCGSEVTISRRERESFKTNQRTHNWRLTEDASPEALRFFYDHMHLPTMHRRHGAHTRSETYGVARRVILRSGSLFFLEEGGKRVSGVLCAWSERGTRLTTRLLGVLDGQQQHYDSGAFKALYHLLIDWAARSGVQRLDLFGTEALLSKGIFQWKRRLGAGVEWPPNHFATKRLYLRVNRDTPAVRDFLADNPLLVPAADGFAPLYFYDDARPVASRVSSKCPNVTDPIQMHLDAFLEPESRSALAWPARADR